jgi:hypothetical protein
MNKAETIAELIDPNNKSHKHKSIVPFLGLNSYLMVI